MSKGGLRRPVVHFFQIASLVMLLIAAALGAAIVTMHFAIHGAVVKVPSLKGMTVAEARSQKLEVRPVSWNDVSAAVVRTASMPAPIVAKLKHATELKDVKAH